MTDANRPGAYGGMAVQNGPIMPTAVRCVMESDEPVPLVRLVGVLDLPGAESVRAALLTYLADRNPAVIVDVSQLSVREPSALSIFAEVAEEAADWAPAQLLLYRSPRGRNGGWSASDLAVATSIDEALAQLAGRGSPQTLAAELEPVVDVARQARQLVTDACARWDLAQLAEPACIAVTELVNNVVVHAKSRMTVRVARRDGALHVAVRDYSARRPIFRGLVAHNSIGGRGLLLVDTVARRWGTTVLADGKVVWAAFSPEDEPLA
jgi:anti-sigma regulatory factor (Ser/Thr protein kinase)